MKHPIKKIIAATALATSLTGCYDAEIPSKVLLTGDSVMQETSGVLAFYLLHNDDAPMLINNSMGGMTMVFGGTDVYWADRLTNIQSEVAVDTVFVSLGINDINAFGQQPDGINQMWEYVPDSIDSFMGSLDSDVEVHWLVPHIFLHQSRLAGPEVDVMRQMLAEAADRWDNLNLIYIDDQPTWIDEDLIHLNTLGEKGVALEMIGRIAQ
jgi:lysophospholipase L1-like esterase